MRKFIRKRTANTKNDILSGLTVALALVPEAVAFAFVAEVDPFGIVRCFYDWIDLQFLEVALE